MHEGAWTINKLVNIERKHFNVIKYINKYSEEFWYAQKLQEALKYSE